MSEPWHAFFKPNFSSGFVLFNFRNALKLKTHGRLPVTLGFDLFHFYVKFPHETFYKKVILGLFVCETHTLRRYDLGTIPSPCLGKPGDDQAFETDRKESYCHYAVF